MQQLVLSVKDTLGNVKSEQVMEVLSDPLTIAIVTVLIVEIVLYLAFYYDWDLPNLMPRLQTAVSNLSGQKENPEKNGKDKDPDTQTGDNSDGSNPDGNEAPIHTPLYDQEDINTQKMEEN